MVGKKSWLGLVCAIVASSQYPSLAQITPDNTLGAEGSVVTPLGPLSDRIDGGATRDANLFHSFQDFNIDAGRGAYFANPVGIENIFSRVTGVNPSNIFGTLGVLGEANLFFLNPNGIIFGENASLDLQGSFLGTTASGFVFGENGVFSAVNPEVPAQILTVNPSAFFFSQIPPGNIASSSVAPSPPGSRILGLRVPNGESLTLLGGNVSIDGGGIGAGLKAFGGRVEIGAVSGTGEVGLNPDGSLTFPEEMERADVLFTNGVRLDVSLNNMGNIAVTGRNIDVGEGSFLVAGIDSRFSSPDSQAGDINLDATGAIQADQSRILNEVFPGSTGNAGDIRINTSSLSLTNGTQLSTFSGGRGNAGDVIINARDRVSVSNRSIILSRIGTAATGQDGIGTAAIGQGGDIRISTDFLELVNVGQLSSATFGQGNAGNVIVEARNGILIEGGIANVSGIFSTVEPDAQGNGGNIELQTDTLQMRNIAQLSSSTRGWGDAGSIRIQARDITFDGEGDSLLGSTGIISGVGFGGIGRGGDIEIETETLQLLNSAELFAGVTGIGIGGDVRIRAQAITLAGQNSNNTSGPMRGSKITGRLGISGRIRGDDGFDIPFGIGRAGSVDIETGSLILRDDASITVSTAGRGDAGNVSVQAETIVLEDNSPIFTSTFGFGNAGDINIKTGSLRLSDGSQLLAFTEGRGTPGNIRVQATDSVELTGFSPTEGIPSALFTDNDTDSVGAGGSITVTTNRFRVADGAMVDARTRNQDSGGNITINTNVFEALGGGQLITTSQGGGRGGTITVNATQQLLIDGSDPTYETRADEFGRNRIGTVEAASGFFVRSQANGDAGDIFINAPRVQVSKGGSLDAETSGVGNGGDINITSDSLNIQEGGTVSTQSLKGSTGRGGNITLNTTYLEISDRPLGGGRFANRAIISANSQGTGEAGNVDITVAETLTLNNSDITTASTQSAGGVINITASDIRLYEDGDITTSVFNGAGGGGNINLTADSVVAFDDSDILAFAQDGRGGDINFNTPAFFGDNFRPAPKNTDPETLDNNDRVDVNASGAIAGDINLPDVSFIVNSLTQQQESLIDSEELLANSCIVRSQQEQPESTFFIVGKGGLPERPGDLQTSVFTLGTIRNLPTDSPPKKSSEWQEGDPIIEPQGVYRLPNGELVLSRECHQEEIDN